MRRILLAHDRDLDAIAIDPADVATLEVLDLNRNPRLGVLPPLRRLSRLRFLYAEATGIEEVPELPPSLEYLNIAGNRLTRLPADPLPRLRELRAHGNPLGELHEDAFAAMPEVRLLALRGCSLGHLPERFDGLTALRDLDLRANGLTDVPEPIAQLPALQRVDLRWNGRRLRLRSGMCRRATHPQARRLPRCRRSRTPPRPSSPPAPRARPRSACASARR